MKVDEIMDLENIIQSIENNINEEDKYNFSIIIKDIQHDNYQFYSSWLFSEEIKYMLISLLQLDIPLYIDIKVNRILETTNELGYTNQIMYNEHLVLIENTYRRFSEKEIRRFIMEMKLCNGNRYNDDSLFLIPCTQMKLYKRDMLTLTKAKELMLQENEITDELVNEIIGK